MATVVGDTKILRAALRPLEAALAEPEVEKQIGAMEALVAIGSVLGQDRAVTPALARLIDVLTDQSHDGGTQVAAAYALREAAAGVIKKPALLRPAIEPLCRVIGEENASVRPDAVEALGCALAKIGDADAIGSGMPALLAALKDEDARVRHSAVLASGWIAQNVEDKALLAPAVPTLAGALKSDDANVRQEAAKALGQIGTAEAKAAVEAHQAREGEQ